ncbi:MAG: DUF6477 family protein [Paracoccaceae bacterium]
MRDMSLVLNKIRRPRLLLSAARIGAANYHRNRDLRRLMRVENIPGKPAILARLVTMEVEFEAARKEKNTTYNISRHIEILAALIAESAGIGSRARA